MAKLLIILAIAAAIWWLWSGKRPGRRLGEVEAAARLLDIRSDASRETILAAHRRLIERVHPDAGGSSTLAAKVNRARDTMLAALDGTPPLT